jgi:hypothetical protein
MDCDQLPLAGNLKQDLALPKIVGVCGKPADLIGAFAPYHELSGPLLFWEQMPFMTLFI